MKPWTRRLLIALCLVQVVAGAGFGLYLAGERNLAAGLAIAVIVLLLTLVLYQAFSAFFQGVAHLKGIAELIPKSSASVDQSTATIGAALPAMQADLRQMAPELSKVLSALAELRQSVDKSIVTIDAALPDMRSDLRQMAPHISDSLIELIRLRQSFDSNTGGMLSNLSAIAAYFPALSIPSTRSFAAVGNGPELSPKSLVGDILDIVEGHSVRPTTQNARAVVQGMVNATQRTAGT